jgi:hypothetical protein
MKTPIGAVVSTITATVFAAAAVGQVKPNWSNGAPSCAEVWRSGRRIVSHLGMVEFRVPRFAHVT